MSQLSVYKYTLVPGTMSITIPSSAKIISAIAQGPNLVVYALCDVVDKSTREVEYLALGTGHWINEDDLKGFNLLNTVLMDNGLVFHIFIKDL